MLTATMGILSRAWVDFCAALHSLLEHKYRALLSGLGVFVGSTAIALLISIAKGVQHDIAREVNQLGVNLLVVLPFRVESDSLFAPAAVGVSRLQDRHVDLVRSLSGVRYAVPIMFVGGTLSTDSNSSPSTMILATRPEWFRIRPSKLSEGRCLEERDAKSPVVVIGSIAKEILFGTESAVGKSVTINAKSYRIIGVTEDRVSEQGVFAFGGFENVAIMPYDYARSEVPSPQVHRIMISASPERNPQVLLQDVERALAATLPRDAFSVVTQEDLLQLIYKVMSILTWLLTGLTSIALFVGGVGIMAIMLMSVQQRTKEIGVRKAVGARNGAIFRQFLIEATLVSMAGGASGLGFASIVNEAMRKLTPLKPLLTWDVIAMCLGVSLVVGTAFGLMPAIQAARNDPCVSLRNE